jgi:multicomponent Na+:H+ antiporter subunit E
MRGEVLDQRKRPVDHFTSAAGLMGRAIVWRAVTFLVLWLVLVGGVDPADRPAGILAIAAATWASLRLLPAAPRRLSPTALARLALRFFRQSIVAGVDVAWRALDPRLPLRPGFVTYAAHLPPPALHALCSLMSLSPGTLPAGRNESGAIVVHCLDVGQQIAANLAADERLLTLALGREPTDG